MKILIHINRAILLYILIICSAICWATFPCPLEAEYCEWGIHRPHFGLRVNPKPNLKGLTLQECYDICASFPTCMGAAFWDKSVSVCFLKYKMGVPERRSDIDMIKIGCSAPSHPSHGTYKIVNQSTPYLQLVCDAGYMLRGRLSGRASCNRSVEISQDVFSCYKISPSGSYKMSGKKGKSDDPLVHSSMEFTTSLTQPDCAWKCAKDRRCQWLTYNYDTGVCTLFQESLKETSLIDSNSTDVFWFKHG